MACGNVNPGVFTVTYFRSGTLASYSIDQNESVRSWSKPPEPVKGLPGLRDGACYD
jgi:hypothetical protein